MEILIKVRRQQGGAVQYILNCSFYLFIFNYFFLRPKILEKWLQGSCTVIGKEMGVSKGLGLQAWGASPTRTSLRATLLLSVENFSC